jgi:hypothetical protein
MFPQKESRKHKKAAKFSRRFTLQSSDFCDSAVTGRNSADFSFIPPILAGIPQQLGMIPPFSPFIKHSLT